MEYYFYVVRSIVPYKTTTILYTNVSEMEMDKLKLFIKKKKSARENKLVEIWGLMQFRVLN